MAELKSNGDGSPVTPDQKQGPGGQEGPNPIEGNQVPEVVVTIKWNPATNQVDVQGPIARKIEMLGLLECSKEAIMNWHMNQMLIEQQQRLTAEKHNGKPPFKIPFTKGY